MWETLIGGALAIAGSVATQIYQVRSARNQKMSEEIAERKVRANAEAYRNIKRIQGAFVQQSFEETAKMALELEQWFFDNVLFLPGDFPNYWLTARTKLQLLATRTDRPADETTMLQQETEQAISAAIREIYKDAGMPVPRWERSLFTADT